MNPMDEGLISALADLRRHFEAIAESLRGDIRTVAEGVLSTDRRMQESVDAIRSELRTGFAETEAVIETAH